MVGLFVTVIITLSLIAGAAAANYYMLASTQAMLAVQQTQVRVQAISDALRSRFSVVDGQVAFSLAGMEKNQALAYKSVLPSDLIFTKTSAGRTIVFCPAIYKENMVATDEFADGATEFAVETDSTYLLGGHAAFRGLVSADQTGTSKIDVEQLNKNGVFGFLISPSPNGKDENQPVCSDIVRYKGADADTYLVKGGSVSLVFANMSKAVSSEYVVSGSSVGVIDGINHVPGLLDAVRLVARNEQAAAKISVTSDVSLNEDDFAALNRLGRGRSIEIISDGIRTVSVDGGDNVLTLPGTWKFTGFNMSGLTLVSGEDSTVTLSDSLIGSIQMNGGKVRISGASQIVDTTAGNADAIVVSNAGSLTLASTLPGEPIVTSSTSGRVAFKVNGGSVNIETDTRIADDLVVYPVPPAVAVASFAPSKPVTRIGLSNIVLGAGSVSAFEDLSQKVVETGPSNCGATGCEIEAFCPADQIVVSADCSSGTGSDMGHALSKFGPIRHSSDGRYGYSCKWQGASLMPGAVPEASSAVSPKVVVNCARP
jgi:hypothetical protein